ncbi:MULTISPECIES: methionyl-tRNA formyltransferase [unclassified Bradyrhizobium]|uniref:methionyl-tRNA formyltransferase n=1 Tax=unclassified Bradyrhizobium TaxID=2631580 RepID=UPI0015C71EC3|nr:MULTISPECIES: methionyl-tRNA formyltransferase [unclassified Bradyrhizobium]MBB4263501.1 methionyl-tRNA formyltransferase [Bradyrhizobium sp. CIR3A]NYG48983.1 methionyl-tRNA formyltransferase [Bradyrhizobium sp. IAR9]
MPLRLIFMGTPDFSVPTLRALVEHGHQLLAVYTRAPKPAKRGLKPQPSEVELEARKLGIPVFTPQTLRTPEAIREFQAFHADAAVVVAYGVILPQEILDAPRFGCFNLHGSLLPRWRGAAPIERAVIEGDLETGVMVMKMDAGLDTGDIALEARVQLTDTDTSGDLRELLSSLGATLMAHAMDKLERNQLNFIKQSEFGIYAAKIDKAGARIDWTLPAHKVLRHIHGYSPAPGAWCEVPIGGELIRIKILRCERGYGEGVPGQLLDDRLTVACGEGSIRILELQRPGKGPMNWKAFQAGARLRPPLRLH